MDQFKENMMGLLVSEKKLAMFNDIDTAMKTAFTKKFNELNQSSIKAVKKTRSAGAAPPGSGFGSKFDPDIQDVASDNGDTTSDDDEDKSEVVANKGTKSLNQFQRR